MASGENHSGNERRSHGLGPAAAPLATLYGLAVLVRRYAYDRRLLRPHSPGVFTVSVGGLEAGGSGKTPVADFVLRALLRARRCPGLLTRGYGRVASGLVLRRLRDAADPATIGDEPAMLVAGGLDIPVAACAERRLGAEALVASGCDALVLDDGFAHRALGRDVDIVVLRGERPFGNGHLLPWGTLREPLSSLRRAHVVWLHCRASPEPKELAWWEEHCPGAVRVVSRAVPDAPRDLHGGRVDVRDRRVVAAAGIARPEDLERSLSALGARVIGTARFRDHHRYGPQDARDLRERLRRAGREHGAEALVVTPKDAIKLGPLWEGPPLWILGTRVSLLSGQDGLARSLGIDEAALCGRPTDRSGS